MPSFRVGSDVFWRQALTLHSVDLTEELLRSHDCVAILAGHSCYDYGWLTRHADLIVDTVNATAGLSPGRARILRLGAVVSSDTEERGYDDEQKVEQEEAG